MYPYITTPVAFCNTHSLALSPFCICLSTVAIGADSRTLEALPMESSRMPMACWPGDMSTSFYIV